MTDLHQLVFTSEFKYTCLRRTTELDFIDILSSFPIPFCQSCDCQPCDNHYAMDVWAMVSQSRIFFLVANFFDMSGFVSYHFNTYHWISGHGDILVSWHSRSTIHVVSIPYNLFQLEQKLFVWHLKQRTVSRAFDLGFLFVLK